MNTEIKTIRKGDRIVFSSGRFVIVKSVSVVKDEIKLTNGDWYSLSSIYHFQRVGTAVIERNTK